MKTKDKYTVITGASMGLGKELAIESARRGRNLFLIALPGRNLKQLCYEIEQMFSVHATGMECDLTNEQQLNETARVIISNYSVDQLINNAGVGGTAKFEETTPEYLDRIIHLNIRATTMLTRLMLPELITHPNALIMNIASVAAFGPLPYKTIYPASKAFIYSFSRSLGRELRNSSVKVVVVTPGPIVTNPDVAWRIIMHGALGRIGLLTAGEITKLALDGAERGKEVIVPGIMNRFNRLLIWLLPTSWNLSFMEQVLINELENKEKF